MPYCVRGRTGSSGLQKVDNRCFRDFGVLFRFVHEAVIGHFVERTDSVDVGTLVEAFAPQQYVFVITPIFRPCTHPRV